MNFPRTLMAKVDEGGGGAYAGAQFKMAKIPIL